MWWIPLAQAGVQAAGSLFGNAAQNQYNHQAQVQQHRYNKELMDMQYQQNLQMWNLQNQYNSPAAQMARYKEAGLNPNLIYGQSNTAGSISPVTPQRTEVTPKKSSVSDVFAAMSNGLLSFQNLANFSQEQRLAEQQIEMNDIRIQNARFDGLIKQFAAEHQDDYLSLKKLQGDYTKSRTDYTLNKDRREDSLFSYQERIQAAAADRAEYDATVGLYVKAEMDRVRLEQEKARLEALKLQPGLTRAKLRKINADIANISSQIAKRSADIDIAYARIAEQNRHNMAQEGLAYDKYDLSGRMWNAKLDSMAEKDYRDWLGTFGIFKPAVSLGVSITGSANREIRGAQIYNRYKYGYKTR